MQTHLKMILLWVRWVIYLAAELAVVACVLGDFHLLHTLTERGTITGAVFADDSDFLGTFSHFEVCKIQE